MAVIEVLTYEVKPGRLEDFLADVRHCSRPSHRSTWGCSACACCA